MIAETEKPKRSRLTRRSTGTTDVPAGVDATVETLVERDGAGLTDTPEAPSPNVLTQLMRRTLAGRRRMVEAQEKLRTMETEIRASEGEKKSRFQRLRAAALDEYRKARAEAERARRQLATSMRLLPGRS